MTERLHFRFSLSCIGEGNGNPLPYSCLENPMDGGAWWAAVHGVARSQTRLSDFTFTFHFHALEKEMATHFSVLASIIPWLEEPGKLQSLVWQRVGQYWATNTLTFNQGKLQAKSQPVRAMHRLAVSQWEQSTGLKSANQSKVQASS